MSDDVKPREFKIHFIDEGYRGYSLVSGMHQEQMLPYIRNQTVTLHVREVLKDDHCLYEALSQENMRLHAALAKAKEGLEFYMRDLFVIDFDRLREDATKIANSNPKLIKMQEALEQAEDILKSVGASGGFSIPFRAREWIKKYGQDG